MPMDDVPKIWPLVTLPMNKGNDPYSVLGEGVIKEGLLINYYAEKDQQKGDYKVIKRWGWDWIPGYNPPNGFRGQGIATWQIDPAVPNVYQTLTVVDHVGGLPIGLYLGGGFVQNLTGQQSSLPQRWDFVPVNSAPPTMFMKQVNNGYIWNGAVANPIVDAVYTGFQANLVPGAASLNGRLYVADIYNNVWGAAGLDNAAVWNALNVIKANDTPGWTKGITRHLQYVLVFKGENTEVFYDAGNATGSPLARVPGVRIPFGLTNFNTVATINDTLFWVSQSRAAATLFGSDIRIVMMHGLEPQVISTPSIERQIREWANDCYGCIMLMGGHRFYTLWCDGEFSLWYDITEGLWTEVRGVPMTINSAYAAVLSFDGRVYNFSPTYLTDNFSILEDPIVGEIYTPEMDFNTDRTKMLNALYFNTDRTVGSTLQVRSSDDDYQTWTDFRPVDLSLQRPALWDEGSFERRVYHIVHKSKTINRMTSLGLQMDLGTL